MKPIFTVHAGEFLVGCEIEPNFPNVDVWIPAKDTGIDLLVSNKDNTKTVSLQIKFSRDYLATNMEDPLFHRELRACGWWTPSRQQIENSRAQYWVFVLVGFDIRSKDFIIIKPDDLLKRLETIHGKSFQKFNIYFWVTKHNKCYEARDLNPSDQLEIADKKFKNAPRDFTTYLNNWSPIENLNGNHSRSNKGMKKS